MSVVLTPLSQFLHHQHYRFYVREMRVLAYAQLLQSYRSLTLTYMAKAFGVTPDFIDKELARWVCFCYCCCWLVWSLVRLVSIVL